MKKLCRAMKADNFFICQHNHINKEKKSFKSNLLKVIFFTFFIVTSFNAYGGDYIWPTSSKNAREKSITIDFQQDYFYSGVNQHWQTDQFLLYEGSDAMLTDPPGS